jgi:hypothetical protein
MDYLWPGVDDPQSVVLLGAAAEHGTRQAARVDLPGPATRIAPALKKNWTKPPWISRFKSDPIFLLDRFIYS